MIKIENSLVETKEIYKEIIEDPGKMFEMMRFDIKGIAEKALCEILKQELTIFLGRDKYERSIERSPNYRNGYTEKRYTVKNIGELKVKIPRDRKGEYSSRIIEKYDRCEPAIKKDISLLFLSGLSTRGLRLISQNLIGRKISHGDVSKVNKELLRGIDAWRLRDLSGYQIKYVYIDGVFFHIRVDRKIEVIPMLVVIGVTKENRKIFLTIQEGDKERASTWREIFKDIKRRGLDKDSIELGIMDGLPGLMTVFKEEFPNAKIQRCQVHVARNVLCKVPRKMKREVSDRLRDIFYAGSRNKAMKAYNKFVNDYNPKIPSAVKCLSNVIDECLTFYSFPSEEWISIRTTNVIERVNKEFKRRTKPMEVLAGESSAYRLLCFIALKMELGWRSVPINKPLKLQSLQLFTQNC